MYLEKILFTEEECDYIKSLASDEFKPLRYFKQPEVRIKVDKKAEHLLLSKFSNFQITALPKVIKILKYSEGIYFNLHIDSDGKDGRIKTVITQLSRSDSYLGGNLEIFTDGNSHKVSKEIGTSVIFPPSSPHRVSKIEKGVRYVMVFWLKAEHLNFSKSII